MQSQGSNINRQKLIQTVEKYLPLISEKKVYEFTQKMLLLAHRKQQTKKIQQAEELLLLSIERLHSNQEVDKNQGYELIDQLLKIYQSHQQIWNLQKAKRVYELLNLRQNERKYQYYVRILKSMKNLPMPRELLEDLVKYYVGRNEFTKAQSHVIELDLSFINSFCEKWCEKVPSEEATAIRCRLALLKGLFSKLQEADPLLQGADERNPFYKFSTFLTSSAKLKSRQAYNLLGSRYAQFLAHDQTYNKIYLGYGSYYFNIKQQKSGLMSLIN